jgi:hypothetical protein
MIRTLLAAAAAFALFSGAPAVACPDCKDCPMHKVAATDDKADKKETADKAPACKCAGADAKECKCGAQCACPHCSAKKAAAPKPEQKKS